MVDFCSYVDTILKKKRWDRARLLKELNKIERECGLKLTRKQNVTNFLNGSEPPGLFTLAKWEAALGLPEGSLESFSSVKYSRNYKRALKEFKEALKGDKE